MRDGKVKSFLLWVRDMAECCIAAPVMPFIILHVLAMLAMGYEEEDYSEKGEIKSRWKKK